MVADLPIAPTQGANQGTLPECITAMNQFVACNFGTVMRLRPCGRVMCNQPVACDLARSAFCKQGSGTLLCPGLNTEIFAWKASTSSLVASVFKLLLVIRGLATTSRCHHTNMYKAHSYHSAFILWRTCGVKNNINASRW